MPQRGAVGLALLGVLVVIAKGDVGNLQAVRLGTGDGWIVAGAPLGAWWVLGERPGVYHLVGAALILPSIWLATRDDGRARR